MRIKEQEAVYLYILLQLAVLLLEVDNLLTG